MKLLGKKQVQVSLAAERQIEIEQGVLLAKKIDNLRQVLSTEEASLEKFRSETIARVKKEIDSFIEKRVAIQLEIESLKEERLLLVFIMDKEWENLHGDKRLEEINKLKSILDNKIFALRDQENELSDRISKLKNEEQKIETEHEQSSKLLESARIKKEEIDALAKKIKEKEIIITTNLELCRSKILRDELENEGIKKDLYNKEGILRGREKDLEIRERQLIDKYATLERTIARYTSIKHE